MRRRAGWVIVFFYLMQVVTAWGQGMVSIQEIQKTEDATGASPLNLTTVDCTGGIVVFKREANKPRLVLVDPNALEGWGGIQVKGWNPEAFDDVALGDWVELLGVQVEENVGTTFLQFSAPFMDVASQKTIVSHGNPLPLPMVVDVNDIAAPVYYVADDVWLSPGRDTERFESMIVQVRDVRVSALGLGAKNDNYSLQAVTRLKDPNAPIHECWVADYLNRDSDKALNYMPPVALDVQFCAVTGLLEQYSRVEEGYDLFQLLTLSQNSFVSLNPADLDRDCDVDLWDAQLLTTQLLGEDLGLEGDLNSDGVVDVQDLELFNQAWQGADLNDDGIVNGDDIDEMPL